VMLLISHVRLAPSLPTCGAPNELPACKVPALATWKARPHVCQSLESGEHPKLFNPYETENLGHTATSLRRKLHAPPDLGRPRHAVQRATVVAMRSWQEVGKFGSDTFSYTVAESVLTGDVCPVSPFCFGDFSPARTQFHSA
jgi:hypothetical protein